MHNILGFDYFFKRFVCGVCGGVSCSVVSVHAQGTQVVGSPEAEDVRCGFWELNSATLQMYYVLLTSETSLQP